LDSELADERASHRANQKERDVGEGGVDAQRGSAAMLRDALDGLHAMAGKTSEKPKPVMAAALKAIHGA